MIKKAHAEHTIQELLANRWSPYGFSERSVSDEDLRSLFEAARWAASSYNEQPWSYIVATRTDGSGFDRMLSCLVDGNQAWAKTAPVLALGVATLNFKRNGKTNTVALHDLGLASGNLLVEATARELCVHQMVGILPDRARELYQIPVGSEAVTGIAIGYAGDPELLPEPLKQRDTTPRERKPLRDFVFGSSWGQPF
jgi:nitroreductase